MLTGFDPARSPPLEWSDDCAQVTMSESRELELGTSLNTGTNPNRRPLDDGAYHESKAGPATQAVVEASATAVSYTLHDIEVFAVTATGIVVVGQSVAADQAAGVLVPGEADTAFVVFELPTDLIPDPYEPLAIVAFAHNTLAP